MKTLKELKKREWPKLIGLQDEVRLLANEYFLSVFARIRFIRILTRAYWDGMDAGYTEGVKDGKKSAGNIPGMTNMSEEIKADDKVSPVGFSSVILVAVLLLFSGCAATSHHCQANGLWFEKTHHKPVKRLTRHQCRDAASGKTMYFFEGGKVHKR